jgi:hypothetical protein
VLGSQASIRARGSAQMFTIDFAMFEHDLLLRMFLSFHTSDMAELSKRPVANTPENESPFNAVHATKVH